MITLTESLNGKPLHYKSLSGAEHCTTWRNARRGAEGCTIWRSAAPKTTSF